MPQMAPMWWDLLFITFNMTLMMMNIMIFWQTNPKNKDNSVETKMNKMIWKW